MGFLACYALVCTYLYYVLKVYYLAEKEAFKQSSQIQPTMQEQEQVVLVQQPQMQ
jgi:hypothetical protein